jgi:hypothetical protein
VSVEDERDEREDEAGQGELRHFHRRVHISYKQEPACSHLDEMEGDIMCPEPQLAADLVAGLIGDWTVTSITITCENSESVTGADED